MERIRKENEDKVAEETRKSKEIMEARDVDQSWEDEEGLHQNA